MIYLDLIKVELTVNNILLTQTANKLNILNILKVFNKL